MSTSFSRLILFVALVGLSTLGIFYYQFHSSVTSYEEKVYEQVSQRSHALAIKQREIVRAKMYELDRVLLTLRDAVKNEQFNQQQLEELMSLQKSYNQEIADFLLLDSQGMMTAWTRAEPMPNVQDRDYFQWQLNQPEDQVFLSSIQVARVEEPFTFFAMSRKITNDQGDFIGVIVATVDIFKFSSTLDDQLFDGRLTHVLVNDESKIIFRLPFAADFINQPLASLDKYGNNIPDQDSYIVLSPFDSINRLVTFQRVPNWPLIVYIGENLSYADQLITEFTTKEQKRWGSLAVFIVLLGVIIIALLKRRYDNALQILQQRKELDDYHHRNRAILEAMPDLVFTLDKSGIILDYQSSSDELLFMSPDQFIGRSFIDVMPQTVAENGYFLLNQVIKTGKLQLYEYPLTIKDQDLYFELRMSKIDDDNILAMARDITARKQAEKQLTWQATHDALTRLPNRVLFYDRLSQAVTKSLRQPSPFALLYLDINGFKPVNDTLGHSIGDQLLIEFSQRLQQHLRASDTFARLAGDEFAIILFDCLSEAKAQELVDKLHDLIEKPFMINTHEILISASIGLIWTNRWEGSVDALVNSADQAMYREKHFQKQEKQDTAR